MVPMGAVCVRNLRDDVTVEDVGLLFDRYGVQAAPMSLAQPQGRCIIRYADEKDAAYVAKVLDGALQVNERPDKTETAARLMRVPTQAMCLPDARCTCGCCLQWRTSAAW